MIGLEVGYFMAEESIYKFINRMSDENAGLPYDFQNLHSSGRIDVRFMLLEDELSFLSKEKLSIELMENLKISVEKQTSTEELRRILDEKPVFLYIAKLNDRLKLYLSEKLINENLLYSFGIKLATQSLIEEEVKLGMIILGFFENDFVKQILKTLGFHSVFTLYALEASKNFVCGNEFVYELVRNTKGYGKLAALHYFEPVFKKQKEWLFHQGAFNEVVPYISSIACLEKPDMADYYQCMEVTGENFSKLAYILAYAGEKTNIKEFGQSFVLADKYLRCATVYARSFIDLAAAVSIKRSIESYWDHDGDDINSKNGWTRYNEISVRSFCNDIINLKKWKNIVLNELSIPKEQTSLIIRVMEMLKLVPDFQELIPLLRRDLFDLDILRFVLGEHSEDYVQDVLKYFNSIMPDNILNEDPQDISGENISSEKKPDIWVVYLLKALRREKLNEEDFFILCLTARFADARIEAIKALHVFKQEWSDRVFPALENTYEREPAKKIRMMLLDLMGKISDGNVKEQRYLDISEIKVNPSIFDICILNTKIAGTRYHDLILVEGRIGAGDILYLVREPDDKYGEKAILITDKEGYVLGYIPEADNPVPASMLDSGEKLYAVLQGNNLETGKSHIHIMLSKKPKKEGKVIKFPY